jgi:hypothetical protein
MKHIKKATATLHREFPHLEVEDHEVVVRFRDPDSEEVVIDLMKPNALCRETFKHTCEVTSNKQTYRIPSLAMALTMKFAAMLSSKRAPEDRHQDAHDFIRLVRCNEVIDENEVTELADHVYEGAGRDLLEKIRKARVGETLVL